jgi:hypothetical protein
MPCPYFEPIALACPPARANARLPLIGEFTGLCHAAGSTIAAPLEVVSRYCNQGYSRGSCAHFPPAEIRASLRYSIVRETAAELDVICIEEADFRPLNWYAIHYQISDGSVLPATVDSIVRAQAAAFCREYVRRRLPE